MEEETLSLIYSNVQQTPTTVNPTFEILIIISIIMCSVFVLFFILNTMKSNHNKMI